MFKCSKCKGSTRMMGKMIVSAPSSMYGNFTKKNIASKDFIVYAVLWDSFDIICEKCGHVAVKANKND